MRDRPHKRLDLYQKSKTLVKEIYKVTKTFPDDEKYILTSQLRRASLSVLLNITEGSARRTNNEFKHFLNIALGSISEVDTILDLANEFGYIDQETMTSLEMNVDSVYMMLNGLIRKLSFTPSSI